MTIAAGFVCHEGVLLASDTLYAGQNKRYGRKLWPIPIGNDGCVGFGGAGTQAGLERVRYEVESNVSPGMSEPEVIEVIQAALRLVIEEMQPKPEELTQGLFAIGLGTKCSLWENQGGSAMLNPIGHPAQCVGWAVSLGHYFLDFLYREPMPIKWARIVASHLVKQARTYSEYCGGDTNFLEVMRDGSFTFVTSQDDINQYEQHLGQLDAAMRAVLPDGRVNDDTLDLRLKAIVAAIQKASKSFVVQASPGEYHIESGSTNVVAPELPTPRINYGPTEDDQ
jgi:hypothetical protein